MQLNYFQRTHGLGSVKKVLIYKPGSIGDTLVSLPALRLVARAFPDADRRILTVSPNGPKIAPTDTILGPLNLVNAYFRYLPQIHDARTIVRLIRKIRRWGPEVLVYVASASGMFNIFRDTLFFVACGIRNFIGIPWAEDLRRCKKAENSDLWEPVAQRFLRSLAPLGNGMLESPASWDLGLTAAERAKADEVLGGWAGKDRFVCASIGTKAWIKDWGTDRWAEVFTRFSHYKLGTGLVLVGSADEYDLSERLSSAWHGPTLNVCGKLTPRESAAVMERAILFTGHDSGPMHLAAAVGKTCVAVFSGQNLPGEWYPFGSRHRILYHKMPCFGCRLVDACPYDKMCIRSISVENVLEALNEVWFERYRRLGNVDS